MYEAHWGLTEKPFLNLPDPRYLYRSPQHEEALLRLIYAVRERMGAAVLTGVFGCGKTLLAHTLARELLQEKYQLAFVTNPRLGDLDLLRTIVHHLGRADVPPNKADVLALLETLLKANAAHGKDTIILIDEAHVITDPSVFEELRLLLNFQTPERFLLTLILLGQPELREKIELNKAFEQRLSVKSHLGPFSAEATAAYISHRLQVAGCQRPIFAPPAVAVIHEYAGGIPRRINRLCDLCLLAGFAKKRTTVDEPIVRQELADLSAEALA